ncbi:toprim domain-containing protein [Deinococcus alpinitundrae]|uniref:toprim domain-containing protein n=1 Tax=Deinococcus alpinitundrae TaxID=468913 RepID=UPI00137B0901|nr:hypothetical protein [Deinococcus alpinitundrae]
MRLRDLSCHVNLPDLIASTCGQAATRGLNRERGGVIRDPRPDHTERRPSFSVYRAGEVWRWKRHGDDGASGDAYAFLLALGYSALEARAELHRHAGIPSDRPAPVTHRPRPPIPASELDRVRVASKGLKPLTRAELTRAARLVAPLTKDDPAAAELRIRRLLNWDGLPAGRLMSDRYSHDGRMVAHAGALVFHVAGPEGTPLALKIRNLGTDSELATAGMERYRYLTAGHGRPALCSPNYGRGSAVLVTEGEFNGAVAARCLADAGIDVQGLAGAGADPHLNGLSGRTVYVYADADEAGRKCLARIARIASQAGATEVRLLTALPTGDFCDLARTEGILALGRTVQALIHESTVSATMPPDGGGNSPTVPPPHPSLRNGVVVEPSTVELIMRRYRARLDKKMRKGRS